MSADLRVTMPPSDRDDYAYILSVSWIGPWTAQARPVAEYLRGDRSDVPAESVEWLQRFAQEGTPRGQTAQRVGGAS